MNIITFRRRPMHTPSRQFGSDFLRTVGRVLMAALTLILAAISLLILTAICMPWFRVIN